MTNPGQTPLANVTLRDDAGTGTTADDFTPAFVGGDADGDRLLDGWIFGAGRGVVDGVWVRGRRLVTRGRHVAREAVAARYADTMRGLLAA